MPKFKQHTPTITAMVIFDDGEAKTALCYGRLGAMIWIDRQIDTYGNHVVASDIFDNSQHVLQVEA